jgi:Ni/Fe-hydrogenase subunit HybB-like protein
VGLRLGDVAIRQAFGAPGRGWFWAEILLGCVVPMAILARARFRRRTGALTFAAILIAGGVALNRLNVVLLGTDIPGPMPGTQPETYFPSLIEIVLAVSLVVATFFVFSLAVKLFPVLAHHQTPGSSAE